MILVSRKETGRASDEYKNPTDLLVRQKKLNKLLVWLSKLIQYPGMEENGGLTSMVQERKDT